MKRYSTSGVIKGNANQNHGEIQLHIHSDGYYEKQKMQMLLKIWRNWYPCALLLGI